MSAAEIIEAFVNEYTASLQILVDEGILSKPRIEEDSTVIYYELSNEVALKISLDVRDVVVDTYIIYLPEAEKSGVGSLSRGQLVKIPLWSVLERLKTTSSEIRADLENWLEARKRAYDRVYRYLKSMRMPEREAVEVLFKTDASHLALILHRYWRAVLAYSMGLLRL